MDVTGWNERYRSRERSAEDLDAAPTPLVTEIAKMLPAGHALDLACGTGRNAIWLAEHGWKVTAIDGAEAAIRTLRERALERNLPVEAQVADLRAGTPLIHESSADLVTICYYLQRDLFSLAKRALNPGGVLLAIVHTTQGDEEPTEHRLRPGELQTFFAGWTILHQFEGPPKDTAHQRAVSEIVVRRPFMAAQS